MTLPKPECEYGFTDTQVKEIMGSREAEFWTWMRGQTSCFCEGRAYNHEKKAYEPSCGGYAHGSVVYPWDVSRFLAGMPVID